MNSLENRVVIDCLPLTPTCPFDHHFPPNLRVKKAIWRYGSQQILGSKDDSKWGNSRNLVGSDWGLRLLLPHHLDKPGVFIKLSSKKLILDLETTTRCHGLLCDVT